MGASRPRQQVTTGQGWAGINRIDHSTPGGAVAIGRSSTPLIFQSAALSNSDKLIQVLSVEQRPTPQLDYRQGAVPDTLPDGPFADPKIAGRLLHRQQPLEGAGSLASWGGLKREPSGFPLRCHRRFVPKLCLEKGQNMASNLMRLYACQQLLPHYKNMIVALVISIAAKRVG